VGDEPTIAPSAYKYSCDRLDILHGYNNAISSETLREDFVMFIGPDTAARILEIGVINSKTGPVIIHAMQARPKHTKHLDR